MILSTLVCTSCGNASTAIENKPNQEEKNLADLIPGGYSVLEKESADLNGDSFTDIVLILEPETVEMGPEVGRVCVIFHGSPDSGLVWFAENDSVVYCADCGGAFGDPFAGLSIDSSGFSIHHYGGSSWRWGLSQYFIFDHKSKAYYLQREERTSFNVHQPDSSLTEERLSTKNFGRLNFSEVNIY